MLVRFWGTRGSLPVAPRAAAIEAKIAHALMRAQGRAFADEAAARRFVTDELSFGEGRTYGGATTCLEIEGADESFFVLDMGSGLRELGNDAFRRFGEGRARKFNFFMSHLHWDHIMGFPFFGPAFDPNTHIVIHSGHADCEQALRRQQEEISFPVSFDWLRAKIEFRVLTPGERYTVDGVDVELMPQDHSHVSYAWKFHRGGKTFVFSTDAEHRMDDLDDQRAFEGFFRDADLVVCDTMYSLAESITLKADWGHSSNVMAVNLCHGAGARKLALFHHEPTSNDRDIDALLEETIQYEALSRKDRQPLEIVCSYDGLELQV
ncbi:MAG: MBL fold metallo-hydrolase [Rhizorhabdus sp.]|jgi:phosphoribosyl 1,2-cyclic phosphodiesterase|uniref:MBL fold metallo-hydrolase n=1 Tax=Rhizorhabdus sp. TaxID=1968843 RepID=UPI001B748DFC|nr:MBL fold metallo-hydrolase [Rhizorhabdus sp.]MBP8232646.1 MBL fold metallo-hydrolase [Rhizorhabdus sp.]